jgi:hypothetical protein
LIDTTILALFVAGVILGPGTGTGQADMLLRAEWIAGNVLRWQAGWTFWFAVTLSFAWSYFALGRNMDKKVPWAALAIGLAVIAAAVDLVGVMVNITVLPELASGMTSIPAGGYATLGVVFNAMESLAYTLVNVVAWGLYSFAGLVLLPAVFATADYPRWLAWLGAVEWSMAMLATVLLVVAPGFATVPLLLSFALFAPWVWASAVWLLRIKSREKNAPSI